MTPRLTLAVWTAILLLIAIVAPAGDGRNVVFLAGVICGVGYNICDTIERNR